MNDLLIYTGLHNISIIDDINFELFFYAEHRNIVKNGIYFNVIEEFHNFINIPENLKYIILNDDIIDFLMPFYPDLILQTQQIKDHIYTNHAEILKGKNISHFMHINEDTVTLYFNVKDINRYAYHKDRLLSVDFILKNSSKLSKHVLIYLSTFSSTPYIAETAIKILETRKNVGDYL